MKRILFALLFSVTSLAHAHGGESTSICPPGSPADCVVPNWGQIGPDGTDDAMAPRANESFAATSGTGSAAHRMAVQVMPVASPASGGRAPLKTVISPRNLFPKETQALTAAIKRARFDADGAIVAGADGIARAAAAAIRRAGHKYALILYIKVPERIKDEDSALLAHKVQSINDVIGKPGDPNQSGKPTT